MHGPNPGWRPGDYWMVCDICGFDYRRSQMKQRWDGLWVCGADWEPRHPQDFVKGVPDRQNPPVVRPAVDTETTTTTLSAGASKGATSIIVTSATGIYENESIGVTLDDGTVQWTLVGGVTGTTITLDEGLDGAAASGNTVYITAAGSFYRRTAVSASDL